MTVPFQVRIIALVVRDAIAEKKYAKTLGWLKVYIEKYINYEYLESYTFLQALLYGNLRFAEEVLIEANNLVHKELPMLFQEQTNLIGEIND